MLVTGGAGYVGSHACKALAEAGITPVAYDNLSTGHAQAVRWGPLLRGDVGDGASLRLAMRQHRVTAVLHFAASTYVGQSMAEPAYYFRNNVANSLTLLEAMAECEIEIMVFSSSSAVYGLPQALPLNEDHPLAPITPYGESKRMVETMLSYFGHSKGLKWTALRYFNVAGADADGEIGESHSPETHLIPLTIGAGLGGAPLTVRGDAHPTPDGTAIRDYVHVSDVARAHVLALRHLREGGQSGCFNLGSGLGCSVRQVVTEIESHLGRSVPLHIGSPRPGDPPVLVADCSRARQALGWQPEFSREDMIASALAWHRYRSGRGPWTSVYSMEPD